jgi:hypothetical protein
MSEPVIRNIVYFNTEILKLNSEVGWLPIFFHQSDVELVVSVSGRLNSTSNLTSWVRSLCMTWYFLESHNKYSKTSLTVSWFSPVLSKTAGSTRIFLVQFLVWSSPLNRSVGAPVPVFSGSTSTDGKKAIGPGL